MTVSSTTNRVDYTGNGSLTTYAYNFRIFADTDLEVYVDDILRTLTTDYTVTGAGDVGGGNVVFLSAPSGAISIIRTVPPTQLTDYVANDSFPAETHEAALDRLTMICQQIIETFGRALKLAKTSMQTDITVADAVAGKYLRVNSNADGIEMSDIAEAGSIGVPVTIADGGTGATTADGARSNLIGALQALNSAQVPVTNPPDATELNSAAFGANVIVVGTVIRVEALARVTASAGSGIMTLRIGTTTGGQTDIISQAIAADSVDYSIHFEATAVVTSTPHLSMVGRVTYTNRVSGTSTSKEFQFDLTSYTVADIVSAKIAIPTGFTGTVTPKWVSITTL